MSDAIERACPPGHRAALAEWRIRLGGAEQRDALQGAADSGAVAALPAALAAWEATYPTREPRLSLGTAAQLERSAVQVDRLLGRGAAAGWLVHSIFESQRHDWLEPVQSVAYFAIGLKQLGREEKRRRRHGHSASRRPWRPRGRA